MKQILFKVQVVNDPVNVTQKLVISDYSAGSINVEPRVKFIDTEAFRIQAVSLPFLQNAFVEYPKGAEKQFNYSISQVRDYVKSIKYKRTSEKRVPLFPLGFTITFVEENGECLQEILNQALDYEGEKYYYLSSSVPTTREEIDKFISDLEKMR